MANMVFTVEVVDDKVRMRQEDGTYTDFSPKSATALGGHLVKAAYEAAGFVTPKVIELRFEA